MATPKYMKTELVLADDGQSLINKFKKGLLTVKGINFAAGKAADKILKEAQQIVAVHDGHLRDSLVVKVRKPGFRRGIAATLTVDYGKLGQLRGGWKMSASSSPGDRAYPYILEYGSSDGTQSPRPYIRKARTKKRNEAKKLFIDTVKKQIDHEIGK